MDLAAKNRLPAAYPQREFVDAGGLMAYGANFVDVARHAATYVDRILKGTKPGDLPVEQRTKFELVIDLKAAKTLGLTIPPSVLARADQVVGKWESRAAARTLTSACSGRHLALLGAAA